MDPDAGTVRVHRDKGAKPRTVGLDPQAFAMMQAWLDRRRQLGVSARQAVFCTLRCQPLQARYVRTLPRLAAKASIDTRVHPLGLRHTHSTELAAERIPVNVIQQQLGDSSLATTNRYLDHIARQALVEAMQTQ